MWKFGYVQLAPSMGISNIIVVLPRFMQGGCLGDTQKVTKKVASEDLLGALVGKKGGIRETKIGDMAKKNILARGGDRSKQTGQCQELPDKNFRWEG